MARTPTGQALTEAHRLAQVALSKSTVRDFLAVWRLLDANALRASFPDYFRAAKLVIDANRRRSTDLAVAYLDAFRRAEGVTAPLTAARAAELAEAQAMTSLVVTGPVRAEAALRAGLPLDTAMTQALTASAGAVTRHTLNASRETIHATVQRDPEARGAARVTDGTPCAFCALLASRGAAYKSEQTASFVCHDGCGCTVEPVYGDDYQLPPQSRAFADLYASTHAADGRGTKNPGLTAFRRAYEGRA